MNSKKDKRGYLPVMINIKPKYLHTYIGLFTDGILDTSDYLYEGYRLGKSLSKFLLKDPTLIFSKQRHQKIKEAQRILIYILRVFHGYTYTEIAELLQCNHATVQYHFKNYRESTCIYKSEKSRLNMILWCFAYNLAFVIKYATDLPKNKFNLLRLKDYKAVKKDSDAWKQFLYHNEETYYKHTCRDIDTLIKNAYYNNYDTNYLNSSFEDSLKVTNKDNIKERRY